MRMYEAAAEVLKLHGQPMSVKEIYNEIIQNSLFKFGAKDPLAVLKQTMRKKSLSDNPVFIKIDNNKYKLSI